MPTFVVITKIRDSESATLVHNAKDHAEAITKVLDEGRKNSIDYYDVRAFHIGIVINALEKSC